MALPTYDSARDEILALFRTKWEADTPAINGGSPIRVEWQGVDKENPPPSDEPYAVIVVRHIPSRQTTFGKTGERRFERRGIVTVQSFTPISRGGGLSFDEKAAIIARDAFEGVGTASGIWFRNTAIREIGKTEAWYQTNITAEFQYDEMR